MAKNGHIIGINGNLVRVEFTDPVVQNEVAFVLSGDMRLKSEVIRIQGNAADLQVFEDTGQLGVGDEVEFTGDLMTVELGPGLLGNIFDGLQNPLPELARECGYFLKRGVYLPPLPDDLKFIFTPCVEPGDKVTVGGALGSVPEGIVTHKIMVPFRLDGPFEVLEIKPAAEYTLAETVARVRDRHGKEHDVRMVQKWPAKIPITAYDERLNPSQTMITKIRIVDTLFPVALGGTYCIPGPFGAGKTVLQQITSRYAEVDVVVIAACGERAGEVVETLKEFPRLEDPRTGRALMERTVIICNTSSMPVPAREASIYTAVTIAEYYRQMGLNVLLLADSTSRWAQALREISGRLEEIPGEEAFPAYLESLLASFYERGGLVRLHDGELGSVTIGGTVSPAGGNFEEPVTQGTLKVVGAFHGLSNLRAEARRYPAIDPLESWSKYTGSVDEGHVEWCRDLLRRGAEINQMMKVLGEKRTQIDDFVTFLKSEYVDAAYLQQDAYHPIDAATSADRQAYVFGKLHEILEKEMRFPDKDEARRFFHQLNQTTKDWNRAEFESPEFKDIEKNIEGMIEEAGKEKRPGAEADTADAELQTTDSK